MVPDNIMRTVTYVIGIVIFVGALLGVDLQFLAVEVPEVLNGAWATIAAIVMAGRGLYDLIADAIKNRGNSFLPFKAEDSE